MDLMVCLLSCWCDIRKLWAPRGCAWMMSAVCVIIMLSPEALTGGLPHRQHSPWWARTITSYQPLVTFEAFTCLCLNCMEPSLLSVSVDFHLPLIFSFCSFFLSYSLQCWVIIIHLSFHNAGNVNDMQQLDWQTIELYSANLAHDGIYHVRNHTSTNPAVLKYRSTRCIFVCVRVCRGGWGSSGFTVIYSLAESKSIGRFAGPFLIAPFHNPYNSSSRLYFLPVSLWSSVISVANNTWVFNPPMPLCVSQIVYVYVCVPSPSGPSIWGGHTAGDNVPPSTSQVPPPGPKVWMHFCLYFI